MQITTFDRKLWNLTSFDTVGYDQEAHEFVVYLFDGTQFHLYEVEEVDIYQFIIVKNKEYFLFSTLLSTYPYIQVKGKISHSL